MNLSPWMFLIFVNIFLLLFDIFIELLPGVMELARILAPVAVKLGIDPVHFAMIVIYNLTLGMITPPRGRTAFRYLKGVARAHGPAGTRACSLLVGSWRRTGAADLPAGAEHLVAARAGIQIAGHRGDFSDTAVSIRFHYTCFRQERVFFAENRRRRMRHPQWWTERSGKRTGNRGSAHGAASRSLLERGRFQNGPPKEQPCIARRISQVKWTAGAARGFWPRNHVCPRRTP